MDEINEITPSKQPKQRKAKKHSVISPLIAGGIGIAALIGIGFVFVFFQNGKTQEVGLEFSKPDLVLVGKPFTVAISFSNPSDDILKDAKLAMNLPTGLSFLGQPQDQRVMEQSIGDVGPGSFSQQTFNLIALSNTQTLQPVTARFTYKVSGSNAQFEEASKVDVVIGQQAVNLSIETPKEVFSGEDFEIKVGYRNDSGQDFESLHLQIDYPPIFKFKSSTRPPDRGNNSWNLGSLARGAHGEFVVKGSIAGPERSFFGFNAALRADFLGREYTISQQAVSVGISVSPLSAHIDLGGISDGVARLGNTLAYTITYRNNSFTTFENITVKADMAGELFDFTTLQSNAFFNSVANTLTWSVPNTPSLAALGPGQSGEVSFRVKLHDNFPIRRLGDKNFTVNVNAQVESPTVPPETAADKTLTIANAETKVVGRLAIDARAFFRDATSGILNAGPFPPKVNQPTQYTVHWIITTQGADFTNVQVLSSLQSGSRWTGNVKSNSDSMPVYEPTTARVTWTIPSISANKGLIGEPIEAVFQIEATPAINQIGQTLTFLSNTTVQGTDSFTTIVLTAADGPLTTGLPDDPTVRGTDTGVKP